MPGSELKAAIVTGAASGSRPRTHSLRRPFKAGYVSAKHGVLGLVKLGRSRSKAPTTAFPPRRCARHMCELPRSRSRSRPQAAAHNLIEDRVLKDVILAAQPVKRLIEPEEVAEVASFLIGPNGRAFTGVPVTMDQGWTAG